MEHPLKPCYEGDVPTHVAHDFLRGVRLWQALQKGRVNGARDEGEILGKENSEPGTLWFCLVPLCLQVIVNLSWHSRVVTLTRLPYSPGSDLSLLVKGSL